MLAAAGVRGGIVACNITRLLLRRDCDRLVLVAVAWKEREGEGEDSWVVVLDAVVGIVAAVDRDRPDWRERSRPKTQSSAAAEEARSYSYFHDAQAATQAYH